MILTDREIQIALDNGRITVAPAPKAEAYSSTSLDLTLDPCYQKWKQFDPSSSEAPVITPSSPTYSYQSVLTEYTQRSEMDSNGIILEPKSFILGWTHENVSLPESSCLAARVEGKSSLARLGLGVHVTAPTIHAGFAGQIQLEISNQGPLRIRLTPGMRVCQLIFEQCFGTPEKGYKGRFLNQSSG